MFFRYTAVWTGTGLAGLLAAACGSSGSGVPEPDASPEEGPALVSIDIEPVDAELVIDDATPATAAYTATGHFDDGSEEDVTDRAVFSLADTGLGSFAGGDFTSTTRRGGRTQVAAVMEDVMATTSLTLSLRKRHDDPASTDLPADPAPLFDGPDDPARAPALVYPNDGVLVPPNLKLLEIHLQPGEDNTIFEISFENELTDVKVYATCTNPLGGGCIYTPDSSVWGWLADTNRGGQELTIRARATDEAGSGVGTSGDVRLAFSLEDVHGGIYYWKAAGGPEGDSAIMRYDFGDPDQMAAERFAGPEKAGGKCVGCHALSRDGTKMVASAGGWDVEDFLLLDVESSEAMGAPAKSAFQSWNPDGSRYVGVFGYQGTSSYDLLLFDGDTGGSAGVIDVGATEEKLATHPDWSPDGSRIVYTRTGLPYEDGANNQRFYRGSIHMVERSGGGDWSDPVELVGEVSGENSFYPSFAPSGELIAFNKSFCPGGDADIDCNADSDPSATMVAMVPEPGAGAILLERANAPGATDAGTELTNSWPKWAPFEFQRTSEADSRLLWITFSSTRNYGLRQAPAGTSAESDSGTLLWMTAIDPDQALAGADPSYPAFCLPFQDLDSSNHIAQWTEQVIDVD